MTSSSANHHVPSPAPDLGAVASGGFLRRDLIAALDIGGTKIAGALVDTRGQLLEQARRATPAAEGAEAVMGAVAEVLGELGRSVLWPRVRAVGIGSAGPVDRRRGEVSPVNIPAWRGFPLARRVEALAGPLPVALAGDGVAIAAAEHWLGAAREAEAALCMVVSTGVGGGLILDRKLYLGSTGNAGHIGHITVDLNGDRCPCGSWGCLELYASGPSITRWAVGSGWRPEAGAASAQAVADAARSGDPIAVAAFERAARALAAGISATAALTEVQMVVIGGGVAQAGAVLFDPLREQLDAFAVLGFVRGLTVHEAALGTRAGLVGAAALAAAELGLVVAT
jgi:glucokinase